LWAGGTSWGFNRNGVHRHDTSEIVLGGRFLRQAVYIDKLPQPIVDGQLPKSLPADRFEV